MSEPLSLVFLGLSITSSWGNGHATTYRSLIKGLAQRGHRVLFLERDVPWYRDNRDAPRPEGCSVALYASTEQLKQRHRAAIEGADAVIVGSYVPDGVEIGAWVQQVARGVRAFYDIDTPVTLRKLGQGDTEYLSPATIPGYDVYFSFSGGPALDLLVRDYGARRALPLYCSVDPDHYYPEAVPLRYDLGYLGTYSADRQPTLEALLLEPARRLADRRFVVAGPSYPAEIDWPPNVERIQHL
ncbi:MAG TPA: glycosyltransferase, partial [Polyangiaceae bacterium]|nr:glycosyltransferase [Polyangiaceae bacterium]